MTTKEFILDLSNFDPKDTFAVVISHAQTYTTLSSPTEYGVVNYARGRTLPNMTICKLVKECVVNSRDPGVVLSYKGFGYLMALKGVKIISYNDVLVYKIREFVKNYKNEKKEFRMDSRITS